MLARDVHREIVLFRLVSINLNGIRSAHTKGVAQWLEQTCPDCVCVQELKAQLSDIGGKFEQLAGLAGYFHCAQKKGYSGVGIYTRHMPSEVVYGLGHEEFDSEGRYIEARFDTRERKFSVISCYFPSGTSGDERQEVKYRFLDFMYAHLMALKGQREFILCGDVNIAHHNIDIKNWRGNQKNSGFLPEERAWMTRLLSGDEGGGGLIDVFRRLNSEPDQYTWWSNRGQAWAKNVGWRIDYQLATPLWASRACGEQIYKDERFSDHAPLVIDYEGEL